MWAYTRSGDFRTARTIDDHVQLVREGWVLFGPAQPRGDVDPSPTGRVDVLYVDGFGDYFLAETEQEASEFRYAGMVPLREKTQTPGSTFFRVSTPVVKLEGSRLSVFTIVNVDLPTQFDRIDLVVELPSGGRLLVAQRVGLVVSSSTITGATTLPPGSYKVYARWRTSAAQPWVTSVEVPVFISSLPGGQELLSPDEAVLDVRGRWTLTPAGGEVPLGQGDELSIFLDSGFLPGQDVRGSALFTGEGQGLARVVLEFVGADQVVLTSLTSDEAADEARVGPFVIPPGTAGIRLRVLSEGSVVVTAASVAVSGGAVVPDQPVPGMFARQGAGHVDLAGVAEIVLDVEQGAVREAYRAAGFTGRIFARVNATWLAVSDPHYGAAEAAQSAFARGPDGSRIGTGAGAAPHVPEPLPLLEGALSLADQSLDLLDTTLPEGDALRASMGEAAGVVAGIRATFSPSGQSVTRYLMDPASPGWRSTLAARVGLVAAEGWDGVVLTDVHTSLSAVRAAGVAVPAAHTDASWAAGTRSLVAAVAAVTPSLLVVEVSGRAWGDRDALLGVAALGDRVRLAPFAAVPGAAWQAAVEDVEALHAAGRMVSVVTDGPEGDGAAHRFAFAVFLLAYQPGDTFMHAQPSGNVPLIAELSLPLGRPVAPRSGGGRIFEQGFALVEGEMALVSSGVLPDPATVGGREGPLAVLADSASSTSVTITWTGADPPSGYWEVRRSGLDSTGAGPVTIRVPAYVRWIRFPALVPATQYTVTVIPPGGVSRSVTVATTQHTQAPSPADRFATRSGLVFGSGARSSGDRAAFTAFGAERGAPLDVCSTTLSSGSWAEMLSGVWQAAVPAGFDGWVALAVPLWPTGSNAADAGAGAYDSQWYALASQLVASGRRFIIRLGYWANSLVGWVCTASRRASWIAAFRRAVDILREVIPADRLAICWDVRPGPKTPEFLAPGEFYPGSAHVDMVGTLARDGSPAVLSQSTWSQFIVQPHGLVWAAQFARANNRLLAVPGWGLTGTPGDNPYYVGAMGGFFREQSDVLAFEAYEGASLSENPQSLAEYKRQILLSVRN